MSFSIHSRQIVPNADVEKLDALLAGAAELQNKIDDGHSDASPRLTRNAWRRYQRAVRRVSGTRYLEHYYTHSGVGIVAGHTEVYFGRSV